MDVLRIASEPITASSILTVSVPWFGKKLSVLEFCILLILFPSISCIPLVVEPKTSKIGFFDFFNSSICNLFRFFAFLLVNILIPAQLESNANKFPDCLTL